MENWTGREAAGTPTPVFSEVHILKSFKSFVLKVRILKELWARFAEVQIPRDLVAGGQWPKRA